MMNLKLAAFCLVAATFGSVSEAFTPTAFVPKTKSSITSNVAPRNMVAGGAEKAYGEEYYEGKHKTWRGGFGSYL